MRAGQATWAECTTSCVSWLKTPIIAVNGFPVLGRLGIVFVMTTASGYSLAR